MDVDGIGVDEMESITNVINTYKYISGYKKNYIGYPLNNIINREMMCDKVSGTK